MWMSKNIAASVPREVAQEGTVTMSNSFSWEAGATVSGRDYPCFAPYGYSYCAPGGESVLLVPSETGSACVGTAVNSNGLSAGEISIRSLGGASVVLKNDGSVIINGLVINKNGEME